jgi:4-hydroxythreonine-4-phosphate dehydrogenase
MRMDLPLAVTMGEPAGIGGEITLAAWLARGRDIPPFYLIDDPERLATLAGRLGWVAPIRPIGTPADALGVFSEAVPVIPIKCGLRGRLGHPDPFDAAAVIGAIETAVADVLGGRALAIVTNPIHKESLYRAGFTYPGHTEFLAKLAATTEPPVMLLAGRGLRVVPVTIHLPLRRAIESLRPAAIVHAGRVVAAALRRDFGIASPVLAVAGLNPHAGEGGALGREEIEIIGPAVVELRDAGIAVEGPLPADAMFHGAARNSYDAALCMYHDQALIPVKTVDFYGTVNVTLGLPFVRTSPDHGTACGLAGSGSARPDSLIAALRLAAEMALRRRAAL